MKTPQEYSFIRYLASKKSLDDRSLNQHVWRTLVESLPPGSKDKPIQVLEVGAGIATMVERMSDWGLLRYAEYTALDEDAGLLSHARGRLSNWSQENGNQIHANSSGGLVLSASEYHIQVEFITTELFDFLSQHAGKRNFDLLIAHAFLDLVDLPSILPSLINLLDKKSLFYFTINFDGITHFEPLVDPDLDAQIQTLYHNTMDKRLVDGKPSGDSRTGRRMISYLEDQGAVILAAGSSDWVVHPVSRKYIQDEAYFLHFIVHTVDLALTGHPQLDQSRFRWWVEKRHKQIEGGQLSYISHQLDFVGYPSK